MKTTDFKVKSSDSKFDLACTLISPNDQPKALVQFSHGMAEHRKRYYPFMQYLALNGYACVINDHRGHGESLDERKLLGHFDDKTGEAIIEDTFCVMNEARKLVPDVPVILFAHSMGTLVSRCFLQKHDGELSALVLSGAPFNNPLSSLGLFLVKAIEKMKGSEYRSSFLQNLSTGSFDKGFKGEGKNAWLNTSPERVGEYNADELCGYMFTADGYRNLFTLMISTFRKADYQMKNPSLPIFFTAGSEDPVIGDEYRFSDTVQFMRDLGYTNVSSFLFHSMRHEILNERNNSLVYSEVLNFLENNVN